jgi:signal transduction histidine kinase/ligand-binding sensor domain-containing protein
MIWIGTLGNGLDMLNPETGAFTHFVNDPNNPASLGNDTVAALLIDKEGTMWIGTHGGLDKFDSETNTFIHYKYDTNDSMGLSNNQVRVLYEDRKGTLWIGTGSPWPGDGGGSDAGGLNKLNKETGTFTQYLHDPNNTNSLFNNKVSAIFEDNSGILWIGTWKNGIQKLDREKGTFAQMFSNTELPEKFIKADPGNAGIEYDYITFFNQDFAGNIWFGTFDTGLYKFDTENEKIINFDGTENSSSGYSGNSPRSSFNSRDGILWIGANGNIYYTDPSIKKIQHTSVSGSSVSSFYEEENGDFWIGTYNEIVRKIRKNGEIKRYVTDDYDINAQYNLGYLVNGDREGNIWVGTTEGLNRFDKKTEKFISYKHDPENKNSISSNHAIITYEDIKSNFWIGTTNGLNLFDRKTGLFQRYYAHPGNTMAGLNNVILSIVEDKSGFIWIGNWRFMGINRFNPESKTFKDYLKGATVWLLFLDSDGILWAGTEQGLFNYEPNIDKFVPFTVDGLAVNIQGATSMLEDMQKNLWVTTSNQIVRINPGRNEVSFFGENYGVGQNVFNFKSGYIRRNGEIYFGDETGYFSFFPDELIKSLKAPELVFTSMSLSDKKLEPGDGGPLNESLNTQKEIQLAYDENVFSIDMAIVDYANPAQNHLAYFLENFDINWHNTNSERRAYYFNVPPGKYTFRVKGVNSYGAWAEKTIDIIILPPWWRTWLAYGFYVLLFIAGVFAVDRFQRARLLRREKEKTRERELAHAREIEKAYTELKTTQTQLIQSEKMASLGELTAGIAHEIQNPLNFVNNFSEVNTELIDEADEKIDNGNISEAKAILKDIKENEQKINHHGQRADAIVKGMLQHSRTSSGQKEPTDINALADEYLRLAFHGLRAKDKSFNANFKTGFDESLPKINVIPQDIGRLLLNLINNAFYAVDKRAKESTPQPPEGGVKNTQPEYRPTVTIGTTSSKSPSGDLGVRISVKDNGPGIPAAIIDKIFQPFYTTKPTGQGTGLGLSLSYDIVKAHGGEIKVKSVEGKGTEFIVQLPV